MRQSKIVEDMEHCIVCGAPRQAIHHAIHGVAMRKLADKYRLTVPLCWEHHQGTNGVHGKNGRELDIQIKQMAQNAFEEKYSREDFIKVFGRSYL